MINFKTMLVERLVSVSFHTIALCTILYFLTLQ